MTGSTGFLGSHLLKRLINKHYNVIALKRSTSSLSRIEGCSGKFKLYDADLTDVGKIFDENRIDCIIHTAANFGRNEESAVDVVRSNVVFPLNLLEKGIRAGIKVFINTDTFTKPDYGRLKFYSLTKRQFNEWLNVFEPGIAVFNLIIHQMYGEDDNSDKFIPFVINKMLGGEKSIDFTAGEQKRDFIYIDDVCDAYLAVLEYAKKNNNGFTQFELGTGMATSIKDAVLMINEIIGGSGIKLNFGAIPYTRNEVMEIRANTDEIYNKINWKYKTNLHEGLKKTVSWYKYNLEI